MDDLSMEIIEILQEDSRTPPARIAAMVGSDEKTVSDIISRLEKDKVILKYTAVANMEKVDSEKVEALIEVKVTPQRELGFDALAERIYRFNEVKALYLMSGAYDFMVLVEGRSMKQVALFVAEKLSVLDNVLSTATHFMLRKYKEGGVIMTDEQKDRRLAVSP